jgi:hypothetical protein
MESAGGAELSGRDECENTKANPGSHPELAFVVLTGSYY